MSSFFEISKKKMGLSPEEEVKVKETTSDEEVSTSADIAASLGSGMARGFVGLPGIPGAIESAIKPVARAEAARIASVPAKDRPEISLFGMPIQQYVEKPKEDMSIFFPTPEEVIQKTATVLPGDAKQALLYEPKTAPGRISRAAGEFAGSAIAPGAIGPKVLKMATTTGLIGGASQAAEEMVEGAGGPVALGLMGLQTALGVRKGKLAKVLGDFDPAGPEAVSLMNTAKRMGVKLTPVEVIGDPRLVTLLERASRNPSAATKLKPFIERRASEIKNIQAQGLLKVGEEIDEPLGLSREASSAAESSLFAGRNVRTRAVKPYYEAAKKETVPVKSVRDLILEAQKKISELPPGNPTTKHLKAFIDRISTVQKTKPKPQEGRRIKGRADQKTKTVRLPIVNAAKLDSAFREFSDKLKIDPASEGGMLSEARGVVGSLNKKLETILTGPSGSKSLIEGKEVYQEMTDALNFIGDSGVRALSKAKESPSKIIDVISNPKTATPQTITRLAEEIIKNDETNEVFPRMAAYTLRQMANKAQQVGKSPSETADSFVGLMRNEITQGNLDAILTGVAKSRGSDPKDLVQGFNDMLDVMNASTKVTGLLKPTGAVGQVQRRILQTVEVINSSLVSRGERKFYNAFVDAILSDDGIKQLEKISRTDAKDRAVSNLLNLAVQSGRQTEGLLAE